MLPWYRWLGKSRDSAVKRVVECAAVFMVAVGVCAWVEAFPGFRDPDTFYHLKMALLVQGQGFVRAFPWLPYTTLAHTYADHQWLYHVILVPFIKAFGPLSGMTVATVFLAACAVTLFYSALKEYGVRWPAAYTGILLTTSSFLFRLNLGKTSAISISVLLATLIALRRDKPLVIFFLAWGYVLLYGGWPLIIAVTGAFVVARLLADRFGGEHPFLSWASHFFWTRIMRGSRHAWRAFLSSAETRGFLAACAGVLTGIVANPYFPSNIRFYYEQIVEIAVVGYRGTIGVGSEWYPYDPAQLFSETGAVFILAMLALGLLSFTLFYPDVMRRGKRLPHRDTVALIGIMLLAAAFLALTFRSKRHVEYMVPFMTFAIALGINALVTRFDWAVARERMRAILPHRRGSFVILASWFGAVFLFLGIRGVIGVHALYQDSIPYGSFAGSAAWLSAHAPSDAIVFHSDWDEFPMLFLRDDKQRYIAGLDPTFFYRQDPARYRLWTDITTGQIPNPSGLVRSRFDARYVVVRANHAAMLSAFEGDPGAVKSYVDSEVTIFTLL
ncbi:MAG: hypothetical protein RLZZ324_287 [Candidatus Parcubacteria bacterium]|jgi:hypothetical protein